MFENFTFPNPLGTPKSKKKTLTGEVGLKPSRGERIYTFRGRSYNVEKELLDEDLNLLNKNRNIKITSVQFGRVKQISRLVSKGNAHIIFFYKGKQKSIKHILENIPGTLRVEEDTKNKLYWVYGRAGSRTWWHNAAKIIGNIR